MERASEETIGNLVLTRKAGEAIILRHADGTSVTIEVAQLSKGRCRLRVTAAHTFKILRKEIDHGDNLPRHE